MTDGGVSRHFFLTLVNLSQLLFLSLPLTLLQSSFVSRRRHLEHLCRDRQPPFPFHDRPLEPNLEVLYLRHRETQSPAHWELLMRLTKVGYCLKKNSFQISLKTVFDLVFLRDGPSKFFLVCMWPQNQAKIS